jgi:DNA-directed RNA polymerase specialized sigma24 family protein
MTNASQSSDRLELERVFLDHLVWIEKTAAAICRRHHWELAEIEEFTARVQEKILADDYAVLRKHRGDSKLTTYLVIVISRFFQDYCDQLWGRWRNSEKARQLGEPAQLLERLTDRDGQSFEVAGATVLRTYNLTREQLDDLWNQLPPRTRRRIEGEKALEGIPTREPGPEDRLLDQENRRRRVEMLAALQCAVARLPQEDTALLRLRFGEGWQIARIARALDLEEKPLYRRLDRIQERLRQGLEAAGIQRGDIGEVLRGLGLAFPPRRRGKAPRNPSTSDEGDGK